MINLIFMMAPGTLELESNHATWHCQTLPDINLILVALFKTFLSVNWFDRAGVAKTEMG
jgi:hypothetical protein